MRTVQVGRWELFKFLLTRVPTVLWAGVKVEHMDKDYCVVSMKRMWRNRNPFNGIYFANILAGAEMATGLMLFDEMRHAERVSKARFVAVIQKVESDYVRAITECATMTCTQGDELRCAVFDAIANGHATVESLVRATNERGKRAAEVRITWHVRASV